MKYYSYRRVSKKEKDTGSVSLPWQKSEIDRWLTQRKVALDGDFPDDGVSAQKHLRDRPQGALLMNAAAEGPCTVIVAKLDRVFRDTEDFLVTWSEWNRGGVILDSVNDKLEMLTATGKLSATIIAAVHEWERETIGERTRSRGLQRKQTGLRYLRDAPYGFRFEGEVTDEKGRKSGGTLVKDEREQGVIQMIRNWRKAGLTLRKIAAGLNIAGEPTRRGKPWIHSSVQTIIDTVKARIAQKKREDGAGPAAPDLNLYDERKSKEDQE